MNEDKTVSERKKSCPSRQGQKIRYSHQGSGHSSTSRGKSSQYSTAGLGAKCKDRPASMKPTQGKGSCPSLADSVMV